MAAGEQESFSSLMQVVAYTIGSHWYTDYTPVNIPTLTVVKAALITFSVS